VLTETIQLTEGVDVDGARHKSITMRLALVQDSIDAQEESEGKSAVYLTCCLLAKSIVKFGTLPEKSINAALVAQLNEVDFERLNEAREVLKKKVVWQG
jgi:phage FluMu protein gp41